MNIRNHILILLFLSPFIPSYSQDKLFNTIVNQENIDSVFVDINQYSNDFILDMKYATAENFLKEKVYNCAECYLRKTTVDALLIANKKFLKKGYKIKFFDCYRPLDVQKMMWKIVADPNYVANPAKGSIHNRGAAVDITLVDKKGNELDMGTAFDFFGPESGHMYDKFSKKILRNRKILKQIMIDSGFESFDSEWWHYNLVGARKYNISNFQWKCD